MDPWDIVVGDDGCTFNDIIKVIMDSKIPLNDGHLFKLMKYMNTKEPTRNFVENRSTQGKTFYECVDKMLEEWRGRMSQDARLTTFLYYLRKCHLKALADALQKHFWPGSTSKTLYEWLLQINGNAYRAHDLKVIRKKNRTAKLVLAYLILQILVTCFVIPVTVVIVTSNTSNNKGESLPTPILPIYWNEIMAKNQTENGDDKIGGFHNQNISTSDNTDKIAVTEPNTMKSTQKVNLVINDSDSLKELFLPENNLADLVDLQFNNSLGQICEKNSMEVSNERLSLPMLQNLVLDVSRDCENLLDIILNSLVITNLKFFRFRGFITKALIREIHEFLHRYYKTLEEFHVMGILESTINLFEIRNTVVLNSVKEVTVKLDHIYDSTVSREFINNRFCSIFPSLSRFETKNVLISYNEFLKLQNCAGLRDLNIAVKVNSDNMLTLGELNWKTKFPFLRNITVKFQFDSCPGHIFFEKLIEKIEMLDKYKLCSNCNIFSLDRKTYCTKGSKPTNDSAAY